jgi:hypothetical protein
MVLYRNEPIAGFFVSRILSLHSYVRIRFILTLLLITNFIVWSWALEEHPETRIQHVVCITYI